MTTASKGRHWVMLAGAAVLAAACGGDESNSGGTSEPTCDATDPACYGQNGWGSGGGNGFPGAGGGSGLPGSGGGGPPPPPGCGNGVVDGAEACDGALLNGATCASGTMGARSNGTVGCATNCQLDYTGCSATPGGGGTGGTGTGGTGTGGLGTGGRR